MRLVPGVRIELVVTLFEGGTNNGLSSPCHFYDVGRLLRGGRFLVSAIMETTPNFVSNSLTDVAGLRASGLFAQGREPSIRSLREWTKLRRIPYVRIGRLIYYDLA